MVDFAPQYSSNSARQYSEKTMPPKRVVIIGAGPAGLTAGYELLRRSQDFSVTILEESSEIGGLSRTVFHNGNRMDIGGHRFFSKDPEVNAMWQELMPCQGAPAYDDKRLGRAVRLAENGADPEKTDRVMLLRTRVSRIFYRNVFFDYPIRASLQTIRGLGLGTTVSAGVSYLRSVLFKLPEKSLENFYINRFGRKLYSIFFEGYTEKLWGRHPRTISADWGAQRVKGLSIAAVLRDFLQRIIPGTGGKKVETSLIKEFHYPKYGPGQFWQIVASELEKMGGKIRFQCRAEKLLRDENGITGVIFNHNGVRENSSCDYVISSMPIKDLIAGMDAVPQSVREVADGLPYRDFITVGLLLDKLRLKNETNLKTLSDIVPDCWIYVQDTRVRLGRIQIFNNWSPYMTTDPENRIWIGLEYFCDEGDSLWSLSPESLKNFGVTELIKIGILDKDAAVYDFHVEKVKKAYPAYFDTYDSMDEIIRFLNPIKNLYCVGRNGQHRYNNMDHSMATSFAAIRHILQGGDDDKSAVWNVNTEKEYHEKNETKTNRIVQTKFARTSDSLPPRQKKRFWFWALLSLTAVFGVTAMLEPLFPFSSGDWLLRARELHAIRSGIDPFDVFSRKIRSPNYVSHLDAPGEARSVHNYAPWTYGFCFPIAFVDKEQWLIRVGLLANTAALLILSCLISLLVRERTGRNDLAAAITATALLLDIFPLFMTFKVGNFSILAAASAFGLVILLEKKHDFLAGFMLAMLMLKIQIGIIFLFPLVIGRRWRTLVTGGLLCFTAACIPAWFVGKSPITLTWQLLYTGDPSFFTPYAGGLFAFLSRNIPFAMLLTADAAVSICVLIFVSWRLRNSDDWLLKLLPAAVIVPLWTYSQTIDLSLFLLPLVYFLMRLVQQESEKRNSLFATMIFSVGLGHALWNVIVLPGQFFRPEGWGWLFVGYITIAYFCGLWELCFLAADKQTAGTDIVHEKN
ncbi:MAG: NAD(P)-binding protein [Lentisphaeria bacterium]|nr:NAD(P)-binding protein [Lentisphaeria bacterium]